MAGSAHAPNTEAALTKAVAPGGTPGSFLLSNDRKPATAHSANLRIMRPPRITIISLDAMLPVGWDGFPHLPRAQDPTPDISEATDATRPEIEQPANLG